MEPEDPSTVVDLQEVTSKEGKTKFNVFWDEAQKFIRESVDSLCRDGANAPYRQYSSKSHITSPQTHKKLI